MTLHFVVTLKLKAVIKKSDRRLRRSGAGSYPTVTLLWRQLELHLILNVSTSSGSSSSNNDLLRDSGAPSSGSNTLLFIIGGNLMGVVGSTLATPLTSCLSICFLFLLKKCWNVVAKSY